MKLATLGFLCMISLAFAPDALALTQDWGGYENDWEPPTSVDYNPPRVTFCVAFKSRNQACRRCEPEYRSNGQPTGKEVCGFVKEKAACDCTRDEMDNSCIPIGNCSYDPR